MNRISKDEVCSISSILSQGRTNGNKCSQTLRQTHWSSKMIVPRERRKTFRNTNLKLPVSVLMPF